MSALRAALQTVRGKDAVTVHAELKSLELQRETDLGIKEISERLAIAKQAARAEAHQARVDEFSQLTRAQREERLAQIKAEMSRLRAEQRALLVVSMAKP